MEFVPDEPALLIEAPAQDEKRQKKTEKILVIADLHIGLERELARKGIIVPDQLLKLQERLFKIIEKTGAERIVILGDVKNEYVGTSWGDLADVPAFFSRLTNLPIGRISGRSPHSRLTEKVKVTIVKGNHDGGIEAVLPKNVDVYEPSGFVCRDCLFTHGQAWPEKTALSARTIIMGHIHPTVEFWSSGARSLEHVWISAPVEKGVIERKFGAETNLQTAVVVPVFNHLAGGVAFNGKDFKPIGPLLSKAVDWRNGDVYLLDGTYLGKLKDMEV